MKWLTEILDFLQIIYELWFHSHFLQSKIMFYILNKLISFRKNVKFCSIGEFGESTGERNSKKVF